MKNLLLVLMLLLSLTAKSQILNKRIESTVPIFGAYLVKGNEAIFGFDDGQYGINIGSQSFPARRAISINSTFDTSSLFLFQFSQFSYIKNIGFYDNHYYAITAGLSPSFPQLPQVFGLIGIAKISQTGRLIWNRTINPPGITGEDFLNSGAVASVMDSSNKFWILSNRRIGNSSQLLHPVVFCIDTTGNLVSTSDVPVLLNSVGQHLYINSKNKVEVVGQQWKRDTATTVKWELNVASPNLTTQFNFGIISERSGGPNDNVFRISQGPDKKYFFYGYSRKFNIPPRQNPFSYRAEIRDSSNALINSLTSGNEWISYATFLNSGELFCQVVTDSGFFLRWYNPNTGNIRQSVFEPVTDTLDGPDITYAYLFPTVSDSGNFYCATNCRSFTLGYFNRIYSLQNVGKVWKPWNNPTGLPNSKPSLSLHAYPNPTSGRFRLRGYKEEEGLTLRLFSNSGKEVWRGIPSPEGEVDISNLSPGLYHVEALTTSGKRWSTRVVRE